MLLTGLELRRLDAQKVQLIQAHGPRSPQTDQIGALIRRYEEVADNSARHRVRAKLAVADLHVALGDAGSVLSALADVAEHGDEVAKSKSVALAATVMSKVKSKKFARSVNKENQGNLCDLAEKIASKSQDGYDLNRLRMFVASLERKPRIALALADDNLVLNPNAAVRDFTVLVRNILRRKDYRKFLPEIGRILGARVAEFEGNGGRSFVQGMRLRFHSDPEGLSTLGLSSIDKMTSERFLTEASFDEVASFANGRELFLYVGEGDEEIKLAALEELRRRIAADPKAKSVSVLNYIRRASNTIRFWSDAAWRDEALAFVEVAAGGAGDHHLQMTMGIVAFLRQDYSAAGEYFIASVDGDTPFAGTGAASYFLNLPSDDQSRRFASQENVAFEARSRGSDAIVACADGGYLKRYAEGYLKSLRAVGSKALVHFHVAGDQSELEQFTTSLNLFEPVSFSFETPPSTSPAYYASMRFLKAHLFLENIADRILLTDIDVVFRENPDVLLREVEARGADLALRMYDAVRIVRETGTDGKELYRYPRTTPWSQINAACLCLTNSPRGAIAAQMIAEDMAGHLSAVLASGKRAWWVDQNSLFFTYRRLLGISDIKIENIEEIGMPFGSFNYSTSRSVGGFNQVFQK